MRHLDEIWKKVSPQAKDLIRKMMERDVDKRLCADDCLKHPWMIPNETMKESVMKLDSDEILRNMQNFFVAYLQYSVQRPISGGRQDLRGLPAHGSEGQTVASREVPLTRQG